MARETPEREIEETSEELFFENDSFRIAVVRERVLCFALVKNGWPTVRSIRVENRTEQVLRNVRVSVDLMAPFGSANKSLLMGPWESDEFDLTPKGRKELDVSENLVLNQDELLALEDTVDANLVVQVVSETLLAETLRTSPRQKVLANNMWHSDLAPAFAVAAFVTPRADAVGEILQRASEIKNDLYKDPNFVGYQADQEEVLRQAETIYKALCDLGIKYVFGDFSDSESGQKIRMANQVLDDLAGNCIDLAVTYASCLMQAGLNAFVWIIDGHAYAGFSRFDPSSEAMAVIGETSYFMDPVEVRNFQKQGWLVPVELTAVSPDERMEFGDAVEAALGHIDEKPLIMVLHINNLHRYAGITPLIEGKDLSNLDFVVRPAKSGKVRRTRNGSLEWVPEPILPGGKDWIDDQSPPRVRQWKRELIDLSDSNPLLRRKDSKEARGQRLDLLDLPPSEVEDMIHEGPLRVATAQTLLEQGTLVPPGGLRPSQDPLGLWALDMFQFNRILMVRRVGRETGESARKRIEAVAEKSESLGRATGTNSLFLAFGEFEDLKPDGTPIINAPVFLVPVSLRPVTNSGGYELVRDESHVSHVNPFLVEYLSSRRRVGFKTLNSPPEDDLGLDLELAFERLQLEVTTLVRDKAGDSRFSVSPNRLSVQPVGNLGPYHLWCDLRENYERLGENRVFSHFLNGGGLNLKPAAADPPKSDEEVESEIELSVTADGPQMRAISEALSGESLVLEGPPGTGKSQTIINIITAGIAGGKSVLFVAEKPTALGVIRRDLSELGFDDFTIEVHDEAMTSGKLWKRFQPRLKNALADERRPDRDVQERYERLRGRFTALLKRLAVHPFAMHQRNAAGESIWTAANRLGLEGIDLADTPDVRLPPEIDRDVVLDPGRYDAALRAVNEVAESAVSCGFIDGEPNIWGLAGLTDEQLEAGGDVFAGQLSEEVQRLGKILEELGGEDYGSLLPVLADWSPINGLTFGNTISELIEDAEGKSLATVTQRTAKREALEALENGLAAFDTRKREIYQTLEVEEIPSELPLEAWKAQLDEIPDRILGIGRKKGLRRLLDAMQESIGFTRQFEPGRTVDLLSEISDLSRQAGVIKLNASETMGSRLDASWHPLEDRAIEALIQTIDDYRGFLDCLDQLAGIREDFENDLEILASLGEGDRLQFLNVAEAWREWCGLLEVSESCFSRWKMDLPWLDAWRRDQGYWSSDARATIGGQPSLRSLRAWSALNTSILHAREAGLEELIERFLVEPEVAAEIKHSFRLAVAKTTLRDLYDRFEFRGFSGPARDELVREYRELASELEAVTREIQINRLAEFREKARKGSSREVGGSSLAGIINRTEEEGYSLFQLLTDFKQEALGLIPCFLMSPQAVATLLPPDPELFDLVVFDEASQIKVAESIGTIGRGRNCVVVGDSKQMPPSMAVGEKSSSESVYEEHDPSAIKFKDPESILDECKQSGLPTVGLKWHYRSEDEALIAFSNLNYYDGELMTIPAPAPPGVRPKFGLEARHVTDGEFEKSTNPKEAEAVLKEVARLLQGEEATGKAGKPSVGIVTLNENQRKYLEKCMKDGELLSTVCGDSGKKAIRKAMSEEGDSGLLLQSIEKVQGDERAVILLSLVRGDRSGKRYGPQLEAPEGWRRVNVAVTRARNKVLVFHSFDKDTGLSNPSDYRAVNDLSAYVRWIYDVDRVASEDDGESSVTVGSDKDVDGRTMNGIASSLAEGIRQLGDYEVQLDYGLSRFRVDVAVRRSGSEVWDLALLLDSEEWGKGRRFVADRDRAPGLFTAARGWPRQMMVYTPDWILSREDVLDRIRRELQAIEAGEDGDGASLEEISEESQPGQTDQIEGAGTYPEALAGDYPAPTGVREPGLVTGEAVEAEDPAGSQPSLVPPTAIVDELLQKEGVRRHLPSLSDEPGQHFRTFDVAEDLEKPLGQPADLREPTGIEIKRIIRAVALIADIEGPIESGRLVAQVAGCFGIYDDPEEFRDLILGQIKTDRFIDSGPCGRFLWPESVDPETWNGFRTFEGQDEATPPPEEIVNAARFVLAGKTLDKEALVQAVERVMGLEDRPGVADRVDRALALGVAIGRLVILDDGTYLEGHREQGALPPDEGPPAVDPQPIFEPVDPWKPAIPSGTGGLSAPGDGPSRFGPYWQPEDGDGEGPGLETTRTDKPRIPEIGLPRDDPAQPFIEFDPEHESNRIKGAGPLDRPLSPELESLLRERIERVVSTEGPVQKERLGNLVIKCLEENNRASKARRQIVFDLTPGGTFKDGGPFGEFAWPPGLDPDSWSGYRKCGSDFVRLLAPQEIVNAARHVITGLEPGLEEQLASVGGALGCERLGNKIKRHIEQALDWGVDQGRLGRRPDGAFIVAESTGSGDGTDVESGSSDGSS